MPSTEDTRGEDQHPPERDEENEPADAAPELPTQPPAEEPDRQPWGVPLPEPARVADRQREVVLSLYSAVALSGVVIIAMAILGVSVWRLAASNQQLSDAVTAYRGADSDCAAARAAATRVLGRLAGFDYESDAAARYQEMVDATTGTVHDYLTDPKVAAAAQQAVTVQKVKRSATVVDAACAPRHDHSVRVMGSLTAVTQNLRTPGPVTATDPVWVDETETDGVWKVSALRIADRELPSAPPAGAPPSVVDVVTGPMPLPPVPAPPPPPRH